MKHLDMQRDFVDGALGTPEARELALPEVLVDKVPIDGLCGKTDEENLGFRYAELDRYIRTGKIDDPEKKAKIDRLHRMNQFKLERMPSFLPALD